MPIFNDLLNAYNAVEIHGHPQITFPSIWHEVKSANAEVTIDTEGRLISVRPLQKWYVEKGEDGKNVRLRGDNEAVTPVTLYSECRSGSTAQPRPLSDNCKYLIRDPEDSKYYDSYMSLLHAWDDYAGGNIKIQAIIAYISSGHIMTDLAEAGLADAKADDLRSQLEKTAVRFVVKDGDRLCKLWEDEELIRSWDEYMENMYAADVLDTVTGTYGHPIHKHPKNILPANANGKLISTAVNEGSLLYMTGDRYTDASQAPPVTWETSVKVHRMARWLCNNRAISIAGRDHTTYWVCFSSDDPAHIDFDILSRETGIDGPAEYVKILRDAIDGNDFDIPDGQIIIAAFDYSSKGRDAVTYYQSVDSAAFFRDLKRWRELYRTDTDAGYYYPSLYRIVQNAYGHYDPKSGGMVAKDAIVQRHLNRLIACMLEGRPVPDDIVHQAVINVKAAAHAENVRDYVILNAYTLLAAKASMSGVKNMITDDKQSRSYLYGRLLALYDYVEAAGTYKHNLNRKAKIDRQTNAVKMWNTYVTRPAATAPLLHGKVMRGYIRYLSKTSAAYYKRQIEDIYDVLSIVETANDKNKPLSDDYIIGYTHQRKALRERSKEKRNELSKGETEHE